MRGTGYILIPGVVYYSMESARKRRVENWAVTENKEFCDSPVFVSQ